MSRQASGRAALPPSLKQSSLACRPQAEQPCLLACLYRQTRPVAVWCAQVVCRGVFGQVHRFRCPTTSAPLQRARSAAATTPISFCSVRAARERPRASAARVLHERNTRQRPAHTSVAHRLRVGRHCVCTRALHTRRVGRFHMRSRCARRAQYLSGSRAAKHKSSISLFRASQPRHSAMVHHTYAEQSARMFCAREHMLACMRARARVCGTERVCVSERLSACACACVCMRGVCVYERGVCVCVRVHVPFPLTIFPLRQCMYLSPCPSARACLPYTGAPHLLRCKDTLAVQGLRPPPHVSVLRPLP